MSKITVWPDGHPETLERVTENAADIAAILNTIGVTFERWPTRALAGDATPDAVLAAYAEDIARLSREGGYTSADVIRLAKGTPNTDPMRQKFLDEHIHAEDEVRFFVEGSGAFYLHAGGKVHQCVCTTGDLIRVPANTPHWFDMGPTPAFTAIRLFTNPEGWVAQFTGDGIARRFPFFAS
jgi:1,2-dihydroxy-3-keto-5-methylthiopentene dioxygenase